MVVAPLIVIVPLLPPQVVGPEEVMPVMTGVAFTITVAVPGAEVQLLTVVVTEYTPPLASWAGVIVGF